MKLLSIAIPCYNSQDYMESCIESLLVGGEEVEILIVDDGSSDRTAEIADDYARKYPTIVKAIHQENGGHGEAVNAGIRNATGLYFKVVDRIFHPPLMVPNLPESCCRPARFRKIWKRQHVLTDVTSVRPSCSSWLL